MSVASRIAIVGASGQLGTDLVRILGSNAIPLRHQQVELTEITSLRSVLTDLHPSAVINAAAYNWVDKAEDEPHVAYAVNALGPRNLALICKELDIPLLHVSSDYVFGKDAVTGPNQPAPHTEADVPAPRGAYAVSKLAGEYFVLGTSPKHVAVRTCGLYGNAESLGKGNFVKTMLRLGKERGKARVVSDQHCTPTSTSDLAAGLVKLLETEQPGLYHLTNNGATTWYEFAREIFRVAGLAVEVEPITTLEFAAKAPRPAFSVLNCDKAKALGIEMPEWQAALETYISHLV
jgi:dTDP-4-dehydrorhamnose reductase